MGYYFPTGAKLNVLRETRTGKWTDVNGSSGVSNAEVSANYLSLAVPHDQIVENPGLTYFDSQYYDYVLLPSKTQDEVKAYAENPDIEILSNSTFAQAVRDTKAGVTGYIFWGNAGSGKAVRIDDVEAEKGSVTIVKDKDTHTVTVGMSDVHQNNDSVTFRVYGGGFELIEADEQVTVTPEKYGVKLTVNTAGARGATFTAKLKYTDLTEAQMQEMANIRENYANSLLGNNMTNKNDAEYRAVMDKCAADAKEVLAHLNRNAVPGTNLFDNLDNQIDWTKGTKNTDGSANLTSVTTRVKSLVLAYTAEGCTEYYHNPDLKKDIDLCINYIFTAFPDYMHYHDKVYANWWDWSIGMPKDLTAIALMLYDDLSQAQRDQFHNAIGLLVPDVNYYWGRSNNGRASRYTATGANGTEMAMLVLLNGLIGNDPVALRKASDTLVNELKYVTSGEGFYEDGSFKQHGNFAYNGSYGVEKLRGVTQIASLTNNTSWACKDANTDIIYEWILNAYRPLYADGGIFDMVQGRSVSRYNRSNITTGRYAMDAILTLSLNAPEKFRDKLLSFAKTQAKLGIEYDAASYYGRLRFSSLIQIKNLLADDSIPLDTEVYTKVYGSMDKAVIHGGRYAMGISMFSKRNAATECGNNENLKGWYTADGMLELYSGDQAQHDKGFWATIDPLRLPGITTNHATQPLKNFSMKANDRAWVGGSSNNVGNYAAIGQDFKSNYSDLEAKKSWFSFGDQVVALGAGITTTEGEVTETIVENRKLDNNNRLLVNGTEQPDQATVKADWAWLSENQQGGGIGYYFPESTDVNVLRETRTGKWSNVNLNNFPGKPDTEAADNVVSNTYLSLAIGHGAQAADGVYSYVLLPGATQAETEAYVKDNRMVILSNTSSLQAAADLAQKTAGFNFWQAAEQAMPEGTAFASIASDAAASVTMTDVDGKLILGIADPTQEGGTVTIILKGAGLEAVRTDDRITAAATGDTLTLTVDVNGLHGESLLAEVAHAPLVTGVDETVRGKEDGMIDGLTTAMEVSADGINYTPVTDPAMTFAPGSYWVRYIAATAATEVVIGQGSMLQVQFVIDGKVEKVVEAPYNGTVDGSEFPAIPEKPGCTQNKPYWSPSKVEGLTDDLTVQAMYIVDEAEELSSPPEVTPDDGSDVKLIVEPGLTNVPTELLPNEELNTTEKISAVLQTVVAQLNDGQSEENTALYDVTLLVDLHDGKGWVLADKEHFPADGKLTVTLPYPEGTGKDTHNFTVVHMFSTSDFGKVPGTTETPAVTKTDAGLQFTVTGLSPVMVAWTEIPPAPVQDDQPEIAQNMNDSTSGKNDVPAPSSAKQDTAAVAAVPATGDSMPTPFVLALLAVISLVGLVICLYRRKKN